MAKNVLIYTTPTCQFCHMAKEFFKDHDVDFKEIPVKDDMEKQKEMVQKSKQMGVPVIDIDGEIVIGFDRERLMELLDIKE